jgi:hypothetical protein
MQGRVQCGLNQQWGISKNLKTSDLRNFNSLGRNFAPTAPSTGFFPFFFFFPQFH